MSIPSPLSPCHAPLRHGAADASRGGRPTGGLLSLPHPRVIVVEHCPKRSGPISPMHAELGARGPSEKQHSRRGRCNERPHNSLLELHDDGITSFANEASPSGESA